MKIRPVKFIKNYIPHAEGSCLFSMGDTTVLCVASVEEKVPQFIEQKGGNQGWLTAEYSFLPRAGKERTPRQRGGGGGRSQEISRLIGRSLRAVVDLEKLGKRTIILDCDVLRADGGTRTTAINGAFISLVMAAGYLVKKGTLKTSPVEDYLSAVSVGIVEGRKILDLCAEEDNNAEVDLNLVMTGSGRIVEIQGTAEGESFSRKDLNAMIDIAAGGIRQVAAVQRKAIGSLE